MTENGIPVKIEEKDHDNEKQLIDSIVESSIIDKVSTRKTQHFSGILYTLLAAFLFTVTVFITKQLKVDLLDALFVRFFFQSFILIIYIKFIKHYSFYKQITKQGIFLLFIYDFFGSTAFYAFFLAYRYLPLPDLTTIRYTQVIWTAIIMSVMYREKPSISIVLAVLLTTIGVVCVAQPKFLFENTFIAEKNQTSTDYHQHLIGLSIAFYCSIAMSILLISNKYLIAKYKIKHSLLMLHFSFISFLIIIIHLIYKYYFIIDKIQTLKNDFFNWKYLCASLACSLQIFTSVLIQKAIKREHPSIFTIVQSSDILFALLLQNIFSSIKSNLLSIFGSILVLTSILIISGYKFIQDKRKKAET